MLRASVEKQTGSLKLPIGGSTFDIVYWSKLSHCKEKTSITVGPKPNIFYALFKEDDVDFEIEVNSNNCCPDRILSYGVDIVSETGGFSLGIREYETPTNQSQLHFLSQPSGARQLFAGVTEYGLKRFRSGPILVSQIMFKPRYSQIIHDLWIQVKTPNEDCLKFQLRSSDSIRNVKKLVREKTGVDPELQELLLNGKFVDDHQYLRDCCDGKTNNDMVTFKLIYKSFSIFVQLPPRELRGKRGKRVQFDVFPMDTVKKLKERIERKTGIGVDRQKLVYAQTTILKDESNLLLFQNRLDVTLKLIQDDEISINGGLPVEEDEDEVDSFNSVLPMEKESNIFFHNFVTRSDNYQPLKLCSAPLSVHEMTFDFCGDPIDENGAIGFGGKLSHTFTPTSFFDSDQTIGIQPFVVEMRLAD